MWKEFDTLNGIEKCAIILMTLTSDQFGEVLSFMTEKEIDLLCGKVANIGSVHKDVSYRVLEEFLESVENIGFVGGFSTIREMIGSLPDNTKNTILAKVDTDIWRRLSFLPKQKVIRYITNELVEIAAIVMTKISPVVATSVIESLDKNHAADLLYAISKVDEVDDKFIRLVEKAIDDNFEAIAKDSTKNSLVEIFNSLDTESEDEILPLLSKYDKTLIDFIKNNQFTFYDIEYLSEGDRKVIVRNVEKELLTLALVGMEEEKQDIYLTGMTQRSIAIIREDIQLLSESTNDSKVKVAQIDIARLVREMIKDGDISPPSK
ncbi:MAG: fliG C-terminal domain protein [Candidatus Xenolissoclinum pacificiensis L6]|uniref:Flagellar motor switch protein FliG n=1 Tax=Candidatus Xenolissoclinum pacificiensis L6 TaxID=1401685 RepID=W2V0E4_9RICK|nr:MAG: fliG C-terminal domain protein [Candidatus Xenolissoclinum pacificiensis L6]